MISEIRIKNFQRIDENISVKLGRVTVLVGENGSGKSSFMKGVHWAIRCATLAENGRLTVDQMDFVPSKDFQDLAHKLKLQNSADGRRINVGIVNSDDELTEISINAARNAAGVNVMISGPMKDVLTDANKPSTSYIPGIAGAAEEETILALPIMHRKAASGEGGSVLRQIILSTVVDGEGTGPEYYFLEELSEWVSKVLPETKFWVKYDRLRDKNIDVKFLTPEMRVAGQSHTVAWKSIDMAGTGFLQVVQIFAYLLYFKPKILLIDEPDAHLHPGRQQLLIRALEAASGIFLETQIVLTTHSPGLVRALSSDSVIHWFENGALRDNGDVVRQRMGWSALDKEILIFTEDGNIDSLQRLIDQWPTLSQKCAIWPTYGSDNLPSGDKAKKIMSRMGIKVLMHRDRDFMSDSDLLEWRRYKQYESHNIKVWFTVGSDIESSFCNISHIKDVFDIDDDVAQSILHHAISLYDNLMWSKDFSAAYSGATNKISKVSSGDPIVRWKELGEYGVGTVKGKKLIELIEKAAVDVLPPLGLGQRVGRRNNLRKPTKSKALCPCLQDAIQTLLI